MAVLLLKRRKTQRDCRDASWAPCSQGSKLTVVTERIAARKKKMGTNQRLSDAILIPTQMPQPLASNPTKRGSSRKERTARASSAINA